MRKQDPSSFVSHVRMADVDSLKEHPRNYQKHPDDQLEHIMHSIREHGYYKNVVVARDGTILAGHGVVQAARKLGITKVPVVQLDVGPDDPSALKVLTGDNEMRHMAEIDDRALTDLLKEILEKDPEEGLMGTGYDKEQLAALILVTRPESEVRDKEQAAEWVGMPDYTPEQSYPWCIVKFKSEATRDKFMKLISVPKPTKVTGKCWTLWWPFQKRRELKALKIQ